MSITEANTKSYEKAPNDSMLQQIACINSSAQFKEFSIEALID